MPEHDGDWRLVWLARAWLGLMMVMDRVQVINIIGLLAVYAFTLVVA
jgi:hypothetical protein